MTAIYQKIFSIISCWSVSIQLCNGAVLSPEVVGQLLGYPSAELLIEDNTSEQRTLIQTPSRRDQKRQTVLPAPAGLQKAYLIHGKNKNSFFPLQVYIGNKGSLLTSEVLDKFAKGDALPVTHRAAGTEGFTSIGTGGWYFTQHFKVKSDIPPENIADSVVANIVVVQPHGQEFDVQIAWRQDLDLEPIPGGDAYYNTFGPSSNQKAEPRLDAAKIYSELSKLVIAEWLSEMSANGVGPPPQPSPLQSSAAATMPTPSAQAPLATATPPTPIARPDQGIPRGVWMVGIATLLGLALLVWKRRS